MILYFFLNKSQQNLQYNTNSQIFHVKKQTLTKKLTYPSKR